ncbi:MAG: hypothetical protein U0Q21_00675 [Dermatophilaceae bacterium]
MPPTTHARAGRVRRPVTSLIVLTVTVTALAGCGGSVGEGVRPSSSAAGSASSSSSTTATSLPGLDDLEKGLETLGKDTTVASASSKLSSARDDLSEGLGTMRDAVKAALDQKKASRWDCTALDARRSAAWGVHERIVSDVEDVDAAYDKLSSALKSFSAKADTLEKQYAEVSEAGKRLLASDALTTRLDSAGTTIQGLLAQITGAKFALSNAKDAMDDGRASADKQYATTRTLVDQCNAHWQHIHDLKNNRN